MKEIQTIDLLKIEEVAEILSISKRGVRRILDRHDIPSYKIMGSVRINRADVSAYLAKSVAHTEV